MSEKRNFTEKRNFADEFKEQIAQNYPIQDRLVLIRQMIAEIHLICATIQDDLGLKDEMSQKYTDDLLKVESEVSDE